MRRANHLPEKFYAFFNSLKSFRVPYRVTFIIFGVTSTVWFLFRVIPKPSRASYPCMKVAAPLMSSFVVYLLGISVSWFSFKKFKQSIRKSKYSVGLLFLFISLLAFGAVVLHDQKDVIARVLNPMDATFPVNSNEPVGVAMGLHPGRVVWIHDTSATNENYLPVKGSNDLWYSNDNSDEAVISRMLEQSLTTYAGVENISDAWDSIFHSFNEAHGKGEVGYTPGERIAFKINLTNQSCSDSERPMRMDATPQLLNAILHQLVSIVGVDQANITMGDPYREFRAEYKDLVMSRYPEVYFVDGAGGNGVHQTVPSVDEVLVFSDGKYKSTLPQQYLDAAYVINIPCLKTHNEAGITLIAKNHQGSFLEKDDDPKSQYAINMHYSLATHTRGAGQYRHTVDYMGHEETGGKGLIYIVDGIWAGLSWEGWITKFKSDPFNNDYPNSIFVSQDPVAIESVCYDVLFQEYAFDINKTDYPIRFKVEIADHLKQCASSDYWPDGLQYDPEGDGTPLASLGVFEHWNNPTDRYYSRNLGTDDGIELVTKNSSVIDYCDSSSIVITHVVGSVTCPQSEDGSIEIEVTGNYPEFSFEWSNGASTKDIYNLSPGNYLITVRDSRGCSGSKLINIPEPNVTRIEETIFNPTCNGLSDGYIKLEVSEGYSPYSITWDSGFERDSIWGLSGGCYNVSTIDDHGCESSKRICLTESLVLKLSLSKQENLCFGDSSGMIYTNASGGIPPYQYSWSDLNSQLLNGYLRSGSYTISVFDKNNCTAVDSITLEDPDKVAISDIIGSNVVESFQSYTYSVADNPENAFQWFVEGGNVITGQGTHVVNIQWGADVSGRVSVIAESEIGCLSDTTQLNVSINATGTKSIGSLGFSIYPNPTSEKLIIQAGNLEPYSVNLFSISGNLLYQETIEAFEWEIDLTDKPKGVYLLIIRSTQAIMEEKIIKL